MDIRISPVRSGIGAGGGGIGNSGGGSGMAVTGRKRALSEILDQDQFSTRVNLNLDNSGLDLGWIRDEVFADEYVVESTPDGSYTRFSAWPTPSPTINMSPVQMLSNNAFNSPPARIKAYNPVQKKYEYECVFCKGNDEPDYVYKTHPIRINETVICPALRKHVCQICGATGDIAHTVKYCPYNNRGFYAGYRQQQQQQQQQAAAIAAMKMNDMTPPGKQPQNLLPPPLLPMGESIYGNRPFPTRTPMYGGGGGGAGSNNGNGKKCVVRKLNFDEPMIPAAKSTAGFFKNLHQLTTHTSPKPNGNGTDGGAAAVPSVFRF